MILLFFIYLQLLQIKTEPFDRPNETVNEDAIDVTDLPQGLEHAISTALPLLGQTRLPLTQADKLAMYAETRRILQGRDVGDTRPYMVWLRPTAQSDAHILNSGWTCGGAIIHEQYILTSAACIEDAKQFYVISGTHKWIPFTEKSNECVNYGQKRAIWKCVPKNYVYDGRSFNNIQWMVGDIAVVKVEEDFDFTRRIRGCDFIPKKVAYNNVSVDHEKPGTQASTAGWGSIEKSGDVILRSVLNSEDLLETDVILISKKNCKKRWADRYHYIINDYMICGKDGTDQDSMSAACQGEVNCKGLIYSEEADDDDARKNNPRSKFVNEPENLVARKASEILETRRSKAGGFCENDHGGPLVVGYGKTAMIIGIISACRTSEVTHKCFGPFLYTSVWKYRNLISCAINKDVMSTEKTCLKLLREQTSETTFKWEGQTAGRSSKRGKSNGHKNLRSHSSAEVSTKNNTTTKASTVGFSSAKSDLNEKVI